MQRRQSPAYGASSLRARYRDPRGAYAPRSWSRRRNCDFCDAQTDMHRSGACKPAVARRRTCKENRKPQVGAHSRSISSGGRQTAEVAVATPQRRSTRHSHATIAPGNSSGGRQPAVVLETYLHTRFRNRSADCRPARWRTPLQPRSWNHGGLTPPALVSRAIRPPTELRLLRCTNAHAQERREPAVWRYRACRGTRESHASAASCKVRNGAR